MEVGVEILGVLEHVFWLETGSVEECVCICLCYLGNGPNYI